MNHQAYQVQIRKEPAVTPSKCKRGIARVRTYNLHRDVACAGIVRCERQQTLGPTSEWQRVETVMIRAALDATSQFGIGRTGLADAGSSTTSGVCGAVSSQLCGCDRLLLSVLLLCALLLIVCKYSYHRYWLTSIKIARVRPQPFQLRQL